MLECIVEILADEEASSINVNLAGNQLNGSIPPEIGDLVNVVQVRLSHNNFSGHIPNTIDGCQLLQTLHLQANSLYGPIPSSLNNLKGLQDLDLSNNSLYGNIPSFMRRESFNNLKNFLGLSMKIPKFSYDIFEKQCLL